jgi:hypothetical protein
LEKASALVPASRRVPKISKFVNLEPEAVFSSARVKRAYFLQERSESKDTVDFLRRALSKDHREKSETSRAPCQGDVINTHLKSVKVLALFF